MCGILYPKKQELRVYTMDYIVLDMEWNQPYAGSPSSRKVLPVQIRGEIIQIGAVRITEDQQVADEFQVLIKPKYFRRLNRRVSKLTGIKEAQLREEALPEGKQSIGNNHNSDFHYRVWKKGEHYIVDDFGFIEPVKNGKTDKLEQVSSALVSNGALDHIQSLIENNDQEIASTEEVINSEEKRHKYKVAARNEIPRLAKQESSAIVEANEDIIESNNAGVRSILDFLTQDKIATLTAENQSLKFAASQAAQNTFITANQEAQTAELIRRLGTPCPVPAYVVPNPNCCYPATNFGGCGCN